MALKEFKIIDADGNIIGTDVLNDEIDEIPENYKLGWGTDQVFYSDYPKYDFATNSWVEVMTDEEIVSYEEQMKTDQERIPELLTTIEDLKQLTKTLQDENMAIKQENKRLSEQVNSTNMDLMGFMDFYFANPAP